MEASLRRLVVDGGRLPRHLWQRIAEEIGLGVLGTGTLGRAWKPLGHFAPAVIVLNVVFPDEGGLAPSASCAEASADAKCQSPSALEWVDKALSSNSLSRVAIPAFWSLSRRGHVSNCGQSSTKCGLVVGAVRGRA
ncbi:MAG: hypothetical protein NZ960_06585 [Candidatus Kapabacteria bacterium]|nr:hypothetical protein [Candidatus Kapabacteria bacterium]MDW8012758.1 hypothetical protein [Bacteroidota bacterium]